jgi:peptide chain release factor subunit 1
MEARHNYLRKVAEMATQVFITDNRPNVKGLILAGSADFKTELSKSDLFDARLQEKVLQIVDIAYGGSVGFNQAIHLSSECLGNIRFILEKKLILQFFTELQMDSGKTCYTLVDTMKALELGAVETLIVWEQYPEECKIIRNRETKEESMILPKETVDDSKFDLVEQIPFIDWIANHYTKFGTKLEFITDGSHEGSQFVKGFSGVGGLLRWKIDFEEDYQLENEIEEDEEQKCNDEFDEEDYF